MTTVPHTTTSRQEAGAASARAVHNALRVPPEVVDQALNEAINLLEQPHPEVAVLMRASYAGDPLYWNLLRAAMLDTLAIVSSASVLQDRDEFDAFVAATIDLDEIEDEVRVLMVTTIRLYENEMPVRMKYLIDVLEGRLALGARAH